MRQSSRLFPALLFLVAVGAAIIYVRLKPRPPERLPEVFIPVEPSDKPTAVSESQALQASEPITQQQAQQPALTNPPPSLPGLVRLPGTTTLQTFDRQPMKTADDRRQPLLPLLPRLIDEHSPMAAEWAYRQVKACLSEPTTREGWEKAKAELRETYQLTGGKLDNEFQLPPLDEGLLDIDRQFSRCEGITETDLTRAIEALRANPSPDTQLTLAGEIGGEEGQAIYGELWSQGYVAGLRGMAKESLAHRIAAEIFDYSYMTTAAQRNPQPLLAKVAEQHHEALLSISRETSPSTFSTAVKEAYEILKNPNCCKL